MQHLQQLLPFILFVQMVSQQWQEFMCLVPTAMEWDSNSERRLRSCSGCYITQKDGSSFIWALGDHARPGGFMAAPSGDTFMWAFFMQSAEVPTVTKTSDDLTRRGGVTLEDEAKKLLEFIVKDRGELIRLAVSETPASGITKVGLFDRKNLNLPFSQGPVALLGDAAHPQSPFMGQGVNEAITDAYVCAMRLSRQPVLTALRAYDSKTR